MFGLLPAAGADGLGRLFFTPLQRQQLESHETSRNSSTDSGDRNYIIVNGVVQTRREPDRMDGNGAAQATEQSGDKNPATENCYRAGESRIRVQLKVGQPLLLESAGPGSRRRQISRTRTMTLRAQITGASRNNEVQHSWSCRSS